MPRDKNRNKWYSATITIPVDATAVVAVGAVNQGAFTIVDLPFVLTKITSKIVGENGVDGATFPDTILQDGQYTIIFRTETHNYMNEPMMADALAGVNWGDKESNVPTPEEWVPKTSITVEIANQLQRTSALTVQVQFHGVEPREKTRESNA